MKRKNGAAQLLFLTTTLSSCTRHQRIVNAQPTLNQDALPKYGPPDRFTEGTSIEQLFKAIDLNGDGRLDRHEVNMYFAKQGAEVSDGLWDDLDRDRDGYIELGEFVRRKVGDEL